LHSSEAQTLQGVHFKMEVVERIVDPDIMGFQEAVERIPRDAQDAAQLSL